MSGAEFAVGVVLAALPIAIKSFDKFFSTLTTFRESPKSVRKLQAIVSTQRVLFRTEVISLSSVITDDRDLIQTWLETPHEVALTLSDIYRNRIDSLQELFQSCKLTLDLFVVTLEEITAEIEALVIKIGKRDSMSRLRACFRSTMKKTELEKESKELRSFNTDFSLISKNIIRSMENIKKGSSQPLSAEEKQPCQRVVDDLNSIERYRRAQQASNMLHEALSADWSCALHRDHAASISCFSRQESERPQAVRFDFTLTMRGECSEKEGKDALWLEVEYLDGPPQQQETQLPEVVTSESEVLADISARLAKYSQTDAISPKKTAPRKRLVKRPPRVQFDISVSQGVPLDAEDETKALRSHNVQNTEPEQQLRDLACIKSTCELLCSQYQSAFGKKEKCLGYLEAGRHLHLFYVPVSDHLLGCEPQTLADILSCISENSIVRSLPLTAIFHVATSLANSFLQLHSTPWFPETWGSQDVLFYVARGSRQNDQGVQLRSPYLKIELPNPRKGKSKAWEPPGDGSHSDILDATSQQELMFRLGVILLEIGFSRPWLTLRELVSLPASRRSEYHIAEKLCVLLVNQMGPDYPRIIRKCIGGDAAVGDNQLSFLTDVILPLQGMKDRIGFLGMT